MVDLLIIAPHPDDAELHAGGLIAAHVARGASVVVVDATRGEMASNGDVATRAREAAAAAAVLGLRARDNLGLPDCGIRTGDATAVSAVISAVRTHQPRSVICLSDHAAHPDHRQLAAVVRDAVKLASLRRIHDGLAPWRVARLWHCEAEWPMASPSLLVPLSEAEWQIKRAAIHCHQSQFFPAQSADSATAATATPISTAGFLDWIDARGRAWGHHAGAAYAEALHADLPVIAADVRLL